MTTDAGIAHFLAFVLSAACGTGLRRAESHPAGQRIYPPQFFWHAEECRDV